MLIRRISFVVAVAVGVSLAYGTGAYAGGFGGLGCEQSQAPNCHVTAGTRGGNKGAPRGGGHNKGASQAGENAGVVCVPSQAGAAPECMTNLPGQGGPGGAPVPVEVVAAQLGAQAAADLQLPKPVLLMNPPTTSRQLVRVPTWMWMSNDSWTPQTATASVPGFSVTATAVPEFARWAMGDGRTVTCRGPGTPWRSGTDPRRASPTCGHTYLRPGRGVLASATVSWKVSWRSADGSLSGAGPALATRASARLSVVEAPALND